jgi:hypothetical protein
VDDPPSWEGAIDSVEELGEDVVWELLKKGNTDEGFVVAVVGVEGAELEICIEASN